MRADPWLPSCPTGMPAPGQRGSCGAPWLASTPASRPKSKWRARAGLRLSSRQPRVAERSAAAAGVSPRPRGALAARGASREGAGGPGSNPPPRGSTRGELGAGGRAPAGAGAGMGGRALSALHPSPAAPGSPESPGVGGEGWRGGAGPRRRGVSPEPLWLLIGRPAEGRRAAG